MHTGRSSIDKFYRALNLLPLYWESVSYARKCPKECRRLRPGLGSVQANSKPLDDLPSIHTEARAGKSPKLFHI